MYQEIKDEINLIIHVFLQIKIVACMNRTINVYIMCLGMNIKNINYAQIYFSQIYIDMKDKKLSYGTLKYFVL